ncbi:MAG: hypothetical protein QM688_11115 [Sphingomonas bacterium]
MFVYAYLDRPLRSLAGNDLFLLSAMRGFVAAAHARRCVCQVLSVGFEARAIPEALPDFVTLMALLNRSGTTPLRFAPLVWPKVTDDEARVLALFALARQGDGDRLAVLLGELVREEAVAPMLGAIDAVDMALAGNAA